MSVPDPVSSCLRGDISPEVAIARLVLAGETASSIQHQLQNATMRNEHWIALYRLVSIAAVDRLRHVIEASKVEHDSVTTPARIAEQFDRAVAISPEASVAMYSLGERSILDSATQEIVEWLRESQLIHSRAAVLDLGSGIGRVAAALAAHVGSVQGIDVSPAMVREAKRRCAGLPNVTFTTTPGTSFDGFLNASFDLVLAVDAFPYLVQAGLAEAHVAGSRRVLRPGGHLAILNLSYRGDLDLDQRNAAAWAAAYDFTLQHHASHPFRLWDAACWVFRRSQTTVP